MTQPAETAPEAQQPERLFEVEVLVQVHADDETAARRQADEILQRAWDTDRGRHHVASWHFEMLPDGLVTDITDDETSS